ncbi:MAG: hypothetical protein GTN78_24240 [Gemmatimonadales bacterium]|nr:hypothetical protein [Gemmatimonadales bacterium]NIN12037.1 hypothetical protein [Gemmatimonadales bacterium]NIR03272.1 hypothetical protein [Gemmatimonadales bacterium]NIS66952.1 hypothetical protein [Gemmatimonadales bacterium]
MALPFTPFEVGVGADGAISVLAELTLKSSVLLLVTGCAALLLRRAPAAVRHLVWSLGLAGALALPVLWAVAPQWQLPGLSGVLPEPVTAEAVVVEQPVSAPIVASTGTGHVSAVEVPPTGAEPAPFDGEVWADGGTVRVDREPVPAGRPDMGVRLDFPWYVWVVAIWALGAVGLVAVVILGIVRVARLGATAAPVTGGHLARCARQLVGRFNIGRPVRFLTSRVSPVPMTWGVVHPTVLLPREAEDWTEDRLRAVLLHELAHVKRNDYLTQLIARFACAIYWFNPLVWLATHRLRIERELACDDAVLRAGSKASAYAGHLLEIARSLRVEPMTSVASVAMARPSQLSGRLLAVLDARRARAGVTAKLAVPAALMAALVVIPLAGASASSEADSSADVSVGGEQASSITRGSADVSLTAKHTARPPGRQTAPAATSDPSERPTIRRPPRRSAVPSFRPTAPDLLTAALQGCDWDRLERTSSSMNIDDERMRIRIRAGDCELDIDADGEIEFSEDDTDVVSISRRGYLDIEEKVGRTVRRLEIEPAADGTLVRRWRVNGETRPYDDEARAWLARILPMLFRATGIGAEQRAERILARGGVDALMQEISLITSDYVARRYFAILLERVDLDPATVGRVVRQAGQEIGSDFELARLLVTVAENQPLDETVRAAYVEAAGSIESDFEHRRVLTAILQREGLSREVADAMLRSARDIESDFELARLLIELVEARPLDETLTPAFFDAANSIDSDFEHRRVLAAVVSKGTPSIEVLDRTLESAITISSDFELGRLLAQVAEVYPVDRALPASYLTAAKTISSGHEAGRVLHYLIGRARLSPEALNGVLEIAETVEEDFELGRVLTAVVKEHTLTDATRPAFFRAAGEIGSDFELGQVLRAVVDQESLTAPTVAAVLAAALEIESDFELARLLVRVAEAFPIDDDLRPAFMRALDTIDSRHERERVLSALYPRGRPADQ